MTSLPCVFVGFETVSGRLSEADFNRLGVLVASLSGVTRALAFVPLQVEEEHPFAADGSGPALVLELVFVNVAAADAALSESGALSTLARAGLPSLAGATISSQRMMARDFAVPARPAGVAPVPTPCTLLVEYPGTCTDLAAWLDHYDSHHPPIMARFPAIRGVATYRPDFSASNALPGTTLTSMQRNKVVFDSAADLVAALASPVMGEMRADFVNFPPFAGKPTHHPMATHDLLSA